MVDWISLVSFPSQHPDHHLGILHHLKQMPSVLGLLRRRVQPEHQSQFFGSLPAIRFVHLPSLPFRIRQSDPPLGQLPMMARLVLNVEQGNLTFGQRFG
jgi:hypothetical protein